MGALSVDRGKNEQSEVGVSEVRNFVRDTRVIEGKAPEGQASEARHRFRLLEEFGNRS